MKHQRKPENEKRAASGKLRLGSLKSYAILLVVVLVTVILGINVFTLIQNTGQLEVSRGISEIRMPLSLRAQDILIGLNQASTAQRGFMLTNNQRFNDERQEVWNSGIWPALEVLKEVKPSLNIEENVQRIEKLEKLIPQFYELQEDIEQQFLSLEASENVNLSEDMDSLALFNAVDHLKREIENRRRVQEMISQKVVPLQQEIRGAIKPLIKTQEDVLTADVEEVVKGIETGLILSLVFSLFGIAIAVVLAFIFVKKLKSSVEKPKKLLDQLAQGMLAEEVEATQDELNDVMEAGNQLNKNLSAASTFARSIGEGDFKSSFQPASEHDILGNALVHMRDRLLEVAEEDKQRNWTTTGLAQIGDILRKEYQEADHLYLNIIKFVVKYLAANQGGLFLVNDEDENTRFLELKACYAYERQKFLQKTIMPGEGLVGQAYVEREPIFLTEIPDSYVQITSGLGDANPSCILISPLKVNDEVSGVLEIASFKVLEAHEVEFITKLSETIASAISSVKVAERTRFLLEETKQQAEEMRAQEEEMRQNNEELQATQEEMQRKSQEAEEHNARLDAILNSTIDAIITINDRGIIQTVNPACEKLFDYSKDEMINANVSMLMTQDHSAQHDSYINNYHNTGERKVIGKTREVEGKRKDGSVFPLSLAVNDVTISGKKFFVGILRDVSEQKELNRQLQNQLEEARAQEEELQQNMEELSAIQESLAQKNKEIEDIRNTEKERAEQKISAQNKTMEKVIEKFKLREKELLEQLNQKGA